MDNGNKDFIRKRTRDSIIQSLRAGVTPKVGLQYIQVGRSNELAAIVNDVENIIDGGASVRFIIGDFGSGKSFFLQLVRNVALEKGIVTMNADLSPDRRLFASKGQARNLYSELTRSIATRTKSNGNALVSIVEKFIFEAEKVAEREGVAVDSVINRELDVMSEYVGGYDFAKIVAHYWRSGTNGNIQLQNDAIRWLRGEISTKTEAYKLLNVRTIIDDSNIYDYLKLLAIFVKKAGYKGLMICLDELVNIYKLAHKQARNSNYEQILRILNDCLQGSAHSIGFVLGGIPEFMTDSSKGLYSYEALKSRLQSNYFAKKCGVVDYSSPVLNLDNLHPEEIFVLLCNIRNVFASGDPDNYLVPDEALHLFLEHCHHCIGEYYFKTPRNTIKAFVDFLSVLEQNIDISWRDLVGSIELKKEIDSSLVSISDDDDVNKNLVTFKI